jgi:hypothetical protein
MNIAVTRKNLIRPLQIKNNQANQVIQRKSRRIIESRTSSTKASFFKAWGIVLQTHHKLPAVIVNNGKQVSPNINYSSAHR